MKTRNKSLMHSMLTFAAIACCILLLEGIIAGNNAGIAQQQRLQFNQTSSSSVLKQEQLLEGISFQIDNVTFSHQMASVNGIQMHYVMGGQGDPIVLLHGWPETWYAWHKVMPALAKNYTVIIPDLPGLGDSSSSSKPSSTGYDGKSVAEDIHQLVSQQLGFKSIFLVGHDIGAQMAYSYAAAHPIEVRKLVLSEFTGFLPGGRTLWWAAFHQAPNGIPEALVQGKEMMYLSWFYHNLAYNPSAITAEDINKYVSHYSAPGSMHAGFEYYRAFPQNANQNGNYSMTTKLTMPVLYISSSYIPGLGGNITTNVPQKQMQTLGQSVQVIQVPNSGHYVPEEQPGFVIDRLFKFFGNSTAISE
jgi:pimeloyl-ACP methyl ester carboxylesterase